MIHFHYHSSVQKATPLLTNLKKHVKEGDYCCMYLKNKLNSNLLEMKLSNNFFLKIISEKKWHLCYSYNPTKNKILSHLHVISKCLDNLSQKKKNDNVIFLSDFNHEPEEKNISNFRSTYNLKNIVKQKTYFKNPHRPVSL